MYLRHCKLILSLLIFSHLPLNFLAAQTSGAGSIFDVSIIIVSAIILVSAVYIVTENLLGIEAQKMGIQDLPAGKNFLSQLTKKNPPKYVSGKYIHLRRGHNIRLKGQAAPEIQEAAVSTYALQPPNFVGMSPIPKVVVEEGQEVLAGDEIFFDKKRNRIKYVAPVSGEIVSINRGAKRAITEVTILADKEQRFREIPSIELASISREDLVTFLLEFGAWPLIKQRPYDIVPNPDTVPENIFISTFDTAPLAPDLDLIIQGQEAAWQAGLSVLRKLTGGSVILGLNANGKEKPADAFTEATEVDKYYFSGPHPAGNVGVQIHHIKPVFNGKEAWVLGVQEVLVLGRLIADRKYDSSRLVALTGQSLADPKYVRTHIGAKLEDLLKNQGLEGDLRIISGDVLSGKAKETNGYLNFYDDQVTVIPEGREFELFGWLLPIKMRPSVSRTFPGFLFKDIKYEVTTNTHGEERAFVMTGQYEQLLPMDIYPQHLMKAILIKDFEKMEGLGIYELSEEDVALAEFACTSKQPLQHILRSGLDLMREQG